jgi:hypothetical protein
MANFVFFDNPTLEQRRSPQPFLPAKQSHRAKLNLNKFQSPFEQIRLRGRLQLSDETRQGELRLGQQ